MSRLIVSDHVTLDGVIEAAGFAEHRDGRNAAEAGDREVVVTRTVRDLATGTDLGSTPFGSVGLRGIPGQRELFEAKIG